MCAPAEKALDGGKTRSSCWKEEMFVGLSFRNIDLSGLIAISLGRRSVPRKCWNDRHRRTIALKFTGSCITLVVRRLMETASNLKQEAECPMPNVQGISKARASIAL